jgi:hypothetical protein
MVVLMEQQLIKYQAINRLQSPPKLVKSTEEIMVV